MESNISKTSACVSSGFPNTRKLMKARGRRPRAFIVFECLETPMKHKAVPEKFYCFKGNTYIST